MERESDETTRARTTDDGTIGNTANRESLKELKRRYSLSSGTFASSYFSISTPRTSMREASG